MMQTVSFELSKQLKEFGFPQNNDWYYWHANIGGQYYLRRMTRTMEEYSAKYDIAAPTADEVLDQLPAIKDGGELYIEKYDKDIARWGVSYKSIRDGKTVIHRATDKTKLPGYNLADAAAKMWLYLEKEKAH